MVDFVVGFSEEIMQQSKEEEVRVFERTEDFEGDVERMMQQL
mgnify:CR=1 FL=1